MQQGSWNLPFHDIECLPPGPMGGPRWKGELSMGMVYPKTKVAAMQFEPKMLVLEGSIAHTADMIRGGQAKKVPTSLPSRKQRYQDIPGGSG